MSSDTAQPSRRLVRITCDVLLPAHFHEADLTDIIVRHLRVEGYSDELLYDLIQATVVETSLQLTPLLCECGYRGIGNHQHDARLGRSEGAST